VVAVSAVTTFTTPFMVRWSTPFSEYLSHKLPRKWIKRIERFSANAQSIKSVSNWQIVLRAYLLQIAIHSLSSSRLYCCRLPICFPGVG
jgi:CPA2 family monovalent cation:H+ antiporter-2